MKQYYNATAKQILKSLNETIDQILKEIKNVLVLKFGEINILTTQGNKIKSSPVIGSLIEEFFIEKISEKNNSFERNINESDFLSLNGAQKENLKSFFVIKSSQLPKDNNNGIGSVNKIIKHLEKIKQENFLSLMGVIKIKYTFNDENKILIDSFDIFYLEQVKKENLKTDERNGVSKKGNTNKRLLVSKKTIQEKLIGLEEIAPNTLIKNLKTL